MEREGQKERGGEKERYKKEREREIEALLSQSDTTHAHTHASPHTNMHFLAFSPTHTEFVGANFATSVRSLRSHSCHQGRPSTFPKISQNPLNFTLKPLVPPRSFCNSCVIP